MCVCLGGCDEFRVWGRSKGDQVEVDSSNFRVVRFTC